MRLPVFFAATTGAMALFSGQAFAAACDGPSGKVQIYTKPTFGSVPFMYRGDKGGTLQYMGKAYAKAFWYYFPNLDPKTGVGTMTIKITDDEKPTRRKNLGVFTTFLDADGKPVTCMDARAGYGDRYTRTVTSKGQPDLWARVKTVLMRPYTYDDGSENDHPHTCITIQSIFFHCN